MKNHNPFLDSASCDPVLFKDHQVHMEFTVKYIDMQP